MFAQQNLHKTNCFPDQDEFLQVVVHLRGDADRADMLTDSAVIVSDEGGLTDDAVAAMMNDIVQQQQQDCDHIGHSLKKTSYRYGIGVVV